MDLSRVSAIAAGRSGLETAPARASDPVQTFGDILGDLLNKVSDSNTKAEQEVQKLLVGQADDVHSVTIALAEAQTMLQLASQIRDRVVEAYRELRQMPM